MKVRTKFTLWISLTALTTAVIFSMVVYFDLLKESYKFVDRELNTVADMVFNHLDLTGPQQEIQLPGQYNSLIERYWLKIFDKQGKTVFASPLAKELDIPRHPDKERYFFKGKTSFSSLSIDPEDLHEIDEIIDDTVKFRVRLISVDRMGENFTILVAKPLLFFDLELNELFRGIASGILAATVFIFLASYLLAGRLLKPLTIINRNIKEIRDNSLDRRIELGSSRDELHTLGQSLNSMFDRLQHSFARQKEFIGNAAHELKSPLTILMLGHEEMLAADPPEPIYLELSKQLNTLNRLSKLVRNLLEIARLEQEETCAREPIVLDGLIARVLDDYREILQARGITVETEIAKTTLFGDPDKILRLVINLIDNAIKYNAEKNGVIRVAAKRSPGNVHLSFANTGPGIPAGDLPRIFDQFYRVEKSRSQAFGGAGLGLTIVRRIVELHGGSIAVQSSDGWTTCTVILPDKTTRLI
ncbi:MAG TPA: two-component sensor histidine kinase [Desulfobulbaceae bacterium]|nr:two-component sensor histidine kinase [Desulfobulbaceae bacterium]